MDQAADNVVITSFHRDRDISTEDLEALTPGELRQLVAESRASITHDVRRVERTIESVAAPMRDWKQTVRQTVRERPLETMGAAFALGLFVGSW